MQFDPEEARLRVLKLVSTNEVLEAQVAAHAEVVAALKVRIESDLARALARAADLERVLAVTRARLARERRRVERWRRKAIESHARVRRPTPAAREAD